MLRNEDMISAVSSYLEGVGYVVSQRGVGVSPNITASRRGVQLLVEARGGLRPDGEPFNRKQVQEHVAQKVYSVMKLRDLGANELALAFPKDAHHLEFLSDIAGCLQLLDVRVLWVDQSGTVSQH